MVRRANLADLEVTPDDAAPIPGASSSLETLSNAPLDEVESKVVAEPPVEPAVSDTQLEPELLVLSNPFPPNQPVAWAVPTNGVSAPVVSLSGLSSVSSVDVTPSVPPDPFPPKWPVAEAEKAGSVSMMSPDPYGGTPELSPCFILLDLTKQAMLVQSLELDAFMDSSSQRRPKGGRSPSVGSPCSPCEVSGNSGQDSLTNSFLY